MNNAIEARDLGPVPEFRWLDIDHLTINAKYQREVSRDGEAMISRIARDFDWRQFTPVTVAPAAREGRYAVIDGQHRIMAALRIDQIDEVPCWIVAADDISAQATTFVGLNKNRMKMMPVNTYHAELAAGDVHAVRINRICQKAGVEVVRKHMSTNSLKAHQTLSVGALKSAARALSERDLEDGLRMIIENLEGNNILRAAMISAVPAVLALGRQTDGFDEERLAKVVNKRFVDIWMDNASSYAKNFGGTNQKALRMAIIKAYNGAGRGAKLPE